VRREDKKILFISFRDQYKKERRQRLAAAREAALTNEQAMIESRYFLPKLNALNSFIIFQQLEFFSLVVSLNFKILFYQNLALCFFLLTRVSIPNI